MKKEITQIVLEKTITIKKFWCKDDFETTEEWEEFISDLDSDLDHEELLLDSCYGDDLSEYISDDDSEIKVTYI